MFDNFILIEIIQYVDHNPTLCNLRLVCHQYYNLELYLIKQLKLNNSQSYQIYKLYQKGDSFWKKYIRHIHTLNLSDCNITNISMLTHNHTLILSENPIANIPEENTIKHIDLVFTLVTDVSMLTNAMAIDISYTDVTYIGVLPKLKHCYKEHDRLTFEKFYNSLGDRISPFEEYFRKFYHSCFAMSFIYNCRPINPGTSKYHQHMCYYHVNDQNIYVPIYDCCDS